ncbi:MAG: queuosine precursor transporter, partial [Gemmatimonadota bacterium]
RRANAVVWTGFWVSLWVLIVIRLGSWVPPVGTEARTPDEVQALYDGVFGQSSRAILASMTAYLLAQLFDVRIFHFWKELTRGRHLWLRNNGSTMFSQLLDTVLVVSILFWAVLPFGTIVQIIVASYVFKLLAAAVDTPLFYLGTRWLGRWIAEDEDAAPAPAPPAPGVPAGD